MLCETLASFASVKTDQGISPKTIQKEGKLLVSVKESHGWIKEEGQGSEGKPSRRGAFQSREEGAFPFLRPKSPWRQRGPRRRRGEGGRSATCQLYRSWPSYSDELPPSLPDEWCPPGGLTPPLLSPLSFWLKLTEILIFLVYPHVLKLQRTEMEKVLINTPTHLKYF